MKRREAKASGKSGSGPVTKPGDLWKELKHTFHTSEAFMDWLHGDVNEDEAEIACLWEYARESKRLWDAAKRRDYSRREGGRRGACKQFERVALEMAARPGGWYPLPPFYCFLRESSAFPKTSWNDLNKTERDEILGFFSLKGTPPLSVADVSTLQGHGIIECLRNTVEKQKRSLQEGDSPTPADAVFDVSPSIRYVVFKIDSARGAPELLKSFKVWLGREDNQAWLNRGDTKAESTADRALDRLKDLAVWRLFREMDNDWERVNDFANQHRKRFKDRREIRETTKMEQSTKYAYRPGGPRPFRDAKPKNGSPPNEADLLGEAVDGYKAKKSALNYLSEIMPVEFPKPASDWMRDVFEEIDRSAGKNR